MCTVRWQQTLHIIVIQHTSTYIYVYIYISILMVRDTHCMCSMAPYIQYHVFTLHYPQASCGFRVPTLSHYGHGEVAADICSHYSTAMANSQ